MLLTGQVRSPDRSRKLTSARSPRHQADHGASHAGTQDCSHYADTVEEGEDFDLDKLKSKPLERLGSSFPSPMALVRVVLDRFLRRLVSIPWWGANYWGT